MNRRNETFGPPTTTERRLLCDEMLQGLGRWLRAAGHDTAIAAGGMADSALLELALAEQRVLVTCDRALGRRAGGGLRVLVLESEGAERAAAVLRDRVPLDWLHAPFSRCLLDNTPLRLAGSKELARVPPRAQKLGGVVRACPACGRVYWPGSHVRRMSGRLRRWQEADRSPYLAT